MTAIGLCSGFVLMKDHPVVFLYGKDKDGQNLPKTAETVRPPRFSAPLSPPRGAPLFCTADNPNQLTLRWRRKTHPRRPTRPTRRRTKRSRAVVGPVGGTKPLWRLRSSLCVRGTNAVYGLGNLLGAGNAWSSRRLELLEQASLGLAKPAGSLFGTSDTSGRPRGSGADAAADAPFFW